MKRKIRQYTKEFKQEAAHFAIKAGSVANTASSLDIPVATLHTWVH